MTTIQEQGVLFKQYMPTFLHGTRVEAASVAATLTQTCTDEWTYRSLVALFASVAGRALRLAAGANSSSGYFAIVPTADGPSAMHTAQQIITAAANNDADMVSALLSAVDGPDAEGTPGTQSVLLMTGAFARSLHQRVCGGGQ